MTHNAGEAGSLYPLEELEAWGDLSVWCSAGLGEGQRGQYVAASLTF